MKVKIINYNKFILDEGYIGSYSNKTTYMNGIFEVFAIIGYEKERKLYILDINDRLNFYKSENFEIVNDSINEDWREIFFPKKYKLKNKYYNFYIKMNYFYGPKKMLEHEDFLFYLIENKNKAKEFLNSLNTVI